MSHNSALSLQWTLSKICMKSMTVLSLWTQSHTMFSTCLSCEEPWQFPVSQHNCWVFNDSQTNVLVFFWKVLLQTRKHLKKMRLISSNTFRARAQNTKLCPPEVGNYSMASTLQVLNNCFNQKCPNVFLLLASLVTLIFFFCSILVCLINTTVFP